jgi:pimeloyl-ACP methyl ester carboxylesterase
MRNFLKKAAKLIGAIFFGLLIVLLILIYVFFKPKSDKEIRGFFEESNLNIKIDYENFQNKIFRVVSTRKKIDTTLPNLLFVHGSPGSAMDFKQYLLDKDLNAKANLIAFDRQGYNLESVGDIQSILFEAALLNYVTSKLDAKKTILVGYSYGGPVALASKKNYKKIVLCAPAVYSEVEPMFWFLNFYKWKATRWLMPDLLKAAAKEKLQHRTDLKTIEQNWNQNPSDIYVIHGDKDWIVPYENSLFIQKQFPEEQFKLITLNEASHDLIWSRFEEVKKELIKVIED